MFKAAMWATDGSTAADLALPYVKRLAEDGAKIVVVHCEEFVSGPKASGYTVHADEDELKAKIERQVKELREQGHEVTLSADRRRVGWRGAQDRGSGE